MAVDPPQLGFAEGPGRLGQPGQKCDQQPLIVAAAADRFGIFDGGDHAGAHGPQYTDGDKYGPVQGAAHRVVRLDDVAHR
jgi:hypothetical protein